MTFMAHRQVQNCHSTFHENVLIFIASQCQVAKSNIQLNTFFLIIIGKQMPKLQPSEFRCVQHNSILENNKQNYTEYI